MSSNIFIPNPFPELSTRKLVDISYSVYVDDTGETGIVRKGEGKTAPVLKIGGERDVLESSASREVDSTIRKTTKKEGLSTNPAILFPSSYFTPIPPMLQGMFAGPLSIIDNPDLVIGIISAVAISRTTDKSYSHYHEQTERSVIDNQELEDQLFS